MAVYMDMIALVWFYALWMGYTLYAKKRAKSVSCLSFELRRKRNDWMQKMLLRDNKMADVGLISTLERNVTFFASSSLLILAGLLTAMTSAADIDFMIQSVLPNFFHRETNPGLILFHLSSIYVFAFFQFTWSLRQYGFCGVLIGAAPDGREMTQEERQIYASRASKVIDQAAHSFNYGLRAIYFSLSVLMWFVSPLWFMMSSVLVVVILKRREFHSNVLKSLQQC